MRRHLNKPLIVLLCMSICAWAQIPESAENTPREIVWSLWRMAARGDLLNAKGLTAVSGLFTQVGLPTDNEPISVYSDYYGINRQSVNIDIAEIDMEYTDLGRIDSALRYTPPVPANAYKTSLRYHLVAVPRHAIIYGPDGKTKVQEKEIPETRVWRIEGPLGSRWTTVNSAIRYVLETREKTTDPTTKKNADETLARLKKLH